jgi:hypothetical protein
MPHHRPASLQLPQEPRAIYSAPDGSCLLVVQDEDGKRTITAYHWSTFGSTDGIPVTLPDFPVDLDAALLTSIVNRNNIHFVGLDLNSRSCRSIVLDITRKATEFAFQQRRSKGSSRKDKQTVHNCLIDCHKDIWTRFPVVAAVKRQTIKSSDLRQQKTLVFVTDDHRRPFSSNFTEMISAFERSSRKPTGDELKKIAVSASPFLSFTQGFVSSPDWSVSRFRAGEWLADLLCHIPIHIAITHENRFVPLKDGVVSPQHEKSLLGAEVNRIVDSLSLGWYESIFQSYWASKVRRSILVIGNFSDRLGTPTLAGEGCIIYGRAVRREELYTQSPGGHVFCGECNAYNRFVTRRRSSELAELSVLRGSVVVRVTYGGYPYRGTGF